MIKRSPSNKQLTEINMYLDNELNSINYSTNGSMRSHHSLNKSYGSKNNSRKSFERLPFVSDSINRRLDGIENKLEDQNKNSKDRAVGNTELGMIMTKLNKLENGLTKIKKKKKLRNAGKSRSSSKNRTYDLHGSKVLPIPVISSSEHILFTKQTLEEQMKKTLTEKDKVRELKAINLELKQKLKKMNIKLTGYVTLQQDYQELLRNFEKSELIRQEQEKLIKTLKRQLKTITR